ncbi:sensor histidine kinase [Burkholderia guangdongensis]|uniref:sensor histidine kinase n=1 Tax=Burkholderia guangdongensis TaxID=1792500 RepID=UPI0015C70D15|nr:ATP-binding protein [Burkholderia guangdongensis]
MDGVKKRLNESIQFRLSVALSLAILFVATAAAAFAFSSAYDEAHELQDDMLRQTATLLDRQSARSPLPSPLPSVSPAPRPADAGRAQESDEAPRLIVAPLPRGGQPAAGAGAGAGADAGAGANVSVNARLAAAAALPDGLHTLRAGGEPVRVLVRTLANGERIAIAQDAGVRDDVARESAWRTALPLLILVPILLVVVADLVRKMFRPIAELSAELDARGEHDLHPVRTDRIPIEVRPFVVAINRMLARVAQSVDAQRRFVADAAHELRSPLTAISLQAERLGDADLPADARTRLATLRGGLERSRHLLDQLLALARIQAVPARPAEAVSVRIAFRRVLEDLFPLADAKQIDIGVEDGPDLLVGVDDVELIALIRNLVDNAIRYTPRGGRVDLAVHADGDAHARLSVADTGPGIAPHERARVFDPFYRVPGSETVGSGLGLSIVGTIAQRIGAGVELAYADERAQRGLLVSVRVPLGRPRRPASPR